MEENREPLSAIAIEKKLQLLRNKHFSEDTIALVKSDYEYGLTEEEISLYLNKSYDIEQMKILSECLHKDVPKDVIDIIKNTKYSVHQMQVSLEFYEKGVPVQTIKEVMDKGEKPITMRRLYEEVLEQLNNVKKQILYHAVKVNADIQYLALLSESACHGAVTAAAPDCFQCLLRDFPCIQLVKLGANREFEALRLAGIHDCECYNVEIQNKIGYSSYECVRALEIQERECHAVQNVDVLHRINERFQLIVLYNSRLELAYQRIVRPREQILVYINVKLCNAAGEIRRIHFQTVQQRGRDVLRHIHLVGHVVVRDKRRTASDYADILVFVISRAESRVMVDTGNFIAHEIEYIRVSLLRIHRDYIIVAGHILKFGILGHFDPEFRDHIRSRGTFDISVMAYRRRYLETLQKNLQAKCAGYRVRVWKVMRLYKHPVSFEQGYQLT